MRTKNLLNPLKREKALNILDDFLKRVKLANQNREYLHNIVYVGLFGSLTEEDMEYVGDIDIYINLHIKKPTYDYRLMFKMERKLCAFVKNKNPYIQMIDRYNLKGIICNGFKIENMKHLLGSTDSIIKRKA